MEHFELQETPAKTMMASRDSLLVPLLLFLLMIINSVAKNF